MFQKGNLASAAVETLVDIVETYLQKVAFDTDFEAPKTKISKNPDEAVEMEPVNLDFEVPIRTYPEVTGEVELVGASDTGQASPGTVRMFRYQLDAYHAGAATAALSNKEKLADPVRNKVKWESFGDVAPPAPVPAGRR
jgi:translation elongation factor EF-Tu-like GTPase